MGEKNWIKEMSLEQLEQMLLEVEQEVCSRKMQKKAEAWEKVKTAIHEFLEFSPIEIVDCENTMHMSNNGGLGMDTLGLIEIDLESW